MARKLAPGSAYGRITEIRNAVVGELCAKGRGLFKMHHEEVGGALGQPLFLNEAMFYALEDANALIALGLFEGERLLGYAIASCAQHPLADTLVCAAQAFFVHPDYRGRGNGTRLLAAMEASASVRGAVMLWHVPTCMKRAEAFERLLRSRGCTAIETIYMARN